MYVICCVYRTHALMVILLLFGHVCAVEIKFSLNMLRTAVCRVRMQFASGPRSRGILNLDLKHRCRQSKKHAHSLRLHPPHTSHLHENAIRSYHIRIKRHINTSQMPVVSPTPTRPCDNRHTRHTLSAHISNNGGGGGRTA